MNEIFNNIKYINTNPSSSTGNKPKNYKKCMVFEYLEDNNKLIFPYLYQKIM